MYFATNTNILRPFSFLSTLVLVFFTCFSLADSILTKSEFTLQALEFKKQIQPESEHKIHEDSGIQTIRPDGSDYFTYLDNAYATYLNYPKQINEVFEQFLTPFNDLVKEEPSAEERLLTIMPVLKDDGYIENTKRLMRQQAPDASFPVYYESLNNGLNLLYVYDTPTNMQFLSNDDVNDLNLLPEALKERALQNLMTQVPEVGISGDANFISYLVADENYEASFLLVNQLWTKDNFPVKGEIVVFAFTRSIVFVTGSEQKDALSRIISIVNDPETPAAHGLATNFLIRNETGWEVFTPSS